MYDDMNYRLQMTKKLCNSQDIITESQNAKFMNCALELNGYDTNFDDWYAGAKKFSYFYVFS